MNENAKTLHDVLDAFQQTAMRTQNARDMKDVTDARTALNALEQELAAAEARGFERARSMAAGLVRTAAGAWTRAAAGTADEAARLRHEARAGALDDAEIAIRAMQDGQGRDGVRSEPASPATQVCSLCERKDRAMARCDQCGGLLCLAHMTDVEPSEGQPRLCLECGPQDPDNPF